MGGLHSVRAAVGGYSKSRTCISQVQWGHLHNSAKSSLGYTVGPIVR